MSDRMKVCQRSTVASVVTGDVVRERGGQVALSAMPTFDRDFSATRVHTVRRAAEPYVGGGGSSGGGGASGSFGGGEFGGGGASGSFEVAPGPPGSAASGPRGTPPVMVCARPLQILGPIAERYDINHAYVDAPPYRYAVIGPTCPQNWYDNPVTGTSGQKWDNSPDPCGKRTTCIPCQPKPGVTDVHACMRGAFAGYSHPSLYRLLGPNSNTFAGTLARACCAGMVPKPPALGTMPGWDHAPAPVRGKGPCPPGPTC